MSTIVDPYRLPVNTDARGNPGWWAMALIIATEAMLFAFLLFSYFYLSSMSVAPWPPTGRPPLGLVVPNTIVLMMSSGTMLWGERGLKRGSQLRFRAGMMLTLALGIIFLSVQIIEYGSRGFTPQSHVYGSLFFTITGFHGAHVLVGLLFNAVVQMRAWKGHFTADRHLAVTNAAMYWHFVDAVWVVVFFSLYITPYLT